MSADAHGNDDLSALDDQRHPLAPRRLIDFHSHYTVDFCAWFERFADANGIELGVNLVDIDLHAAANTAGPAVHTDLRRWTRRRPSRMVLFHMPNLDGIGAPRWQERERDHLHSAVLLGARGIKVWKNLGLWQRDTDGEIVDVTDPRLHWLWTEAAALGIPITIHVGDAAALFDPLTPDNERFQEIRLHPELWVGDRQRFPTLETIHADFETLVTTYSSTTFVAAHFGTFMPFSRLHALMTSCPNLYVDTAARISDMGRAQNAEHVSAIFGDFPDRILFGTDIIRAANRAWLPEFRVHDEDPYLTGYLELHRRFFETRERLPLPLPRQGTWTITGLGLPETTLDRLYHGNADRLLRIAPSEPNRA